MNRSRKMPSPKTEPASNPLRQPTQDAAETQPSKTSPPCESLGSVDWLDGKKDSRRYFCNWLLTGSPGFDLYSACLSPEQKEELRGCLTKLPPAGQVRKLRARMRQRHNVPPRECHHPEFDEPVSLAEIEREFLYHLSTTARQIEKVIGEAALRLGQRKALQGVWKGVKWTKRTAERLLPKLRRLSQKSGASGLVAHNELQFWQRQLKFIQENEDALELFRRCPRFTDLAVEHQRHSRIGLGVGDKYFHGDDVIRWHRVRTRLTAARTHRRPNAFADALKRLDARRKFPLAMDFLFKALRVLLPGSFDSDWLPSKDCRLVPSLMALVPRASESVSPEEKKVINQVHRSLRKIYQVLRLCPDLRRELICLAFSDRKPLSLSKALRDFTIHSRNLDASVSAWRERDIVIATLRKDPSLSATALASEVYARTGRKLPPIEDTKAWKRIEKRTERRKAEVLPRSLRAK